MRLNIILGLALIGLLACSGENKKEDETNKGVVLSKPYEQQKRIRDYHHKGVFLKIKYSNIAKSKDTLGKDKYAPELKLSIQGLHKDYFRKIIHCDTAEELQEAYVRYETSLINALAQYKRG